MCRALGEHIYSLRDEILANEVLATPIMDYLPECLQIWHIQIYEVKLESPHPTPGHYHKPILKFRAAGLVATVHGGEGHHPALL